MTRGLGLAAVLVSALSGGAAQAQDPAEGFAGKTLSCALPEGGTTRASTIVFAEDGRYRIEGEVETMREGCVSEPSPPDWLELGKAYRITETCASSEPAYAIEHVEKFDIRGGQLIGVLRGKQTVNGVEQSSWEGGSTTRCDGAVCTRHTDVSSLVAGESEPRQRSYDETCTLE